ncbi:hypothetical protein H8A95_39800, partial [Bradyrhizobium sp. Pear76]|nr:hypothetical protein [Bradyrhizobium oropedii]
KDAARTESASRELETPALAQQQIVRGNADIFKKHLAVAVWRIVIAKHEEYFFDLDAECV